MGIKKAPSTGAVENGSVANVEDKHFLSFRILNKKTPATFEVTGVCKRIEFYGVGVI